MIICRAQCAIVLWRRFSCWLTLGEGAMTLITGNATQWVAQGTLTTSDKTIQRSPLLLTDFLRLDNS